jgi:hypothetical protein
LQTKIPYTPNTTTHHPTSNNVDEIIVHKPYPNHNPNPNPNSITLLVTLAIESNQISHSWNNLMYKKQHQQMINIYLD